MTTKLSESPELYSIDITLPENPLKNLNCYVLKTPERNLVIDTGFNRPECREALLTGLAELGVALDRTDLFLTHLHSDHIGLAQLFAVNGSTIYMSPVDYDYFCATKRGEVWGYMEDLFVSEGFPAEELSLQLTGNQGRRYAPGDIFPITPVEDGQELKVGDVVLRCVAVPGHTPGQTLLYLPQSQFLFSADHVLFDITPNISVWKGVEGSLASYLESLKKIEALPVNRTFPAHRKEGKELYRRIRELRDHHNWRLEEMLQAVKQHPGASALQVAGQVKWSARGQALEQFPPHQKWFAMGETLAHLYHLEAQGRVGRRKEGGLYRYWAK